MDITWDEFSEIAPHLDEVTQLRIMNAVLNLRIRGVRQANAVLQEQLDLQRQAVERLEDDLRETNGAYQ